MRALAALKRLGFIERHRRGSHVTLHRQRAEGRTDVIVLLLGRKELPRGLLRTELTRAGISPEEFIAALR